MMKFTHYVPAILLSCFIVSAIADPLNWDSGSWNLDTWQGGGDPEYLDTDNDGVLNLNDSDDDGDGFNDDDDQFPLDDDEWLDSDNDGVGNNADLDDDNDGYSDEYELAFGTSSTDVNDIPLESQFLTLLIAVIAAEE